MHELLMSERARKRRSVGLYDLGGRGWQRCRCTEWFIGCTPDRSKMSNNLRTLIRRQFFNVKWGTDQPTRYARVWQPEGGKEGTALKRQKPIS